MHMVDNKRVPANADKVEQARDVKEEYGDTWTDVVAFYVDHRGESAAEQVDTDDLRERLERIEAAATTAEERTGELQSTLEELQNL